MVPSQVPEFVRNDSPKFVAFLQAYYEWMYFSQVIVEDASQFDKGDTIIGLESSAEGSVKGINLDKNMLYVEVGTEQHFRTKETIQNANNTEKESKIITYTINPLAAAAKTTEFLNVDNTVDLFIDSFYQEFAPKFPRNTLLPDEEIIKNIKDFNSSKGTLDSYRYLFRILYNEEIDFRFPKDYVFGPSDNEYTSTIILKTEKNALPLKGFEIIGQTSFAVAIVEDVIEIQTRGSFTYNIYLNKLSIRGNFIPNEYIKINDPSFTDVYELRSNDDISPIKLGTNFRVGESISLTEHNRQIEIKVQEVYSGKIDSIFIQEAGTGYNVGDALYVEQIYPDYIDPPSFDSPITYSKATGFVSKTGTDGSIQEVKLNTAGNRFEFVDIKRSLTIHSRTIVGENAQFTNLTKNVDSLIFQHNGEETEVVLTDYVDNKQATVEKNIFIPDFIDYKIRVRNPSGTVTVSGTTITGTGTEFENISVGDIIILNGEEKEILNISSQTLTVGSTFTGTYTDVNYELILVNPDGQIKTIDTATCIPISKLAGKVKKYKVSFVDPILAGNDAFDLYTNKQFFYLSEYDKKYQAASISDPILSNFINGFTFSLEKSATAPTEPFFNNSRSFLSSNQKIQDSYYYQNLSYEIISNVPVSEYKAIIKQLVHSAGTKLFGKIELEAEFSGQIQILSDTGPEAIPPIEGVEYEEYVQTIRDTALVIEKILTSKLWGYLNENLSDFLDMPISLIPQHFNFDMSLDLNSKVSTDQQIPLLGVKMEYDNSTTPASYIKKPVIIREPFTTEKVISQFIADHTYVNSNNVKVEPTISFTTTNLYPYNVEKRMDQFLETFIVQSEVEIESSGVPVNNGGGDGNGNGGESNGGGGGGDPEALTLEDSSVDPLLQDETTLQGLFQSGFSLVGDELIIAEP